jgi:hypothetical protein
MTRKVPSAGLRHEVLLRNEVLRRHQQVKRCYLLRTKPLAAGWTGDHTRQAVEHAFISPPAFYGEHEQLAKGRAPLLAGGWGQMRGESLMEPANEVI